MKDLLQSTIIQNKHFNYQKTYRAIFYQFAYPTTHPKLTSHAPPIYINLQLAYITFQRSYCSTREFIKDCQSTAHFFQSHLLSLLTTQKPYY